MGSPKHVLDEDVYVIEHQHSMASSFSVVLCCKVLEVCEQPRQEWVGNGNRLEGNRDFSLRCISEQYMYPASPMMRARAAAPPIFTQLLEFLKNLEPGTESRPYTCLPLSYWAAFRYCHTRAPSVSPLTPVRPFACPFLPSRPSPVPLFAHPLLPFVPLPSPPPLPPGLRGPFRRHCETRTGRETRGSARLEPLFGSPNRGPGGGRGEIFPILSRRESESFMAGKS